MDSATARMRGLERRQFLRLGVLLASTSLLAACGGQVADSPPTSAPPTAAARGDASTPQNSAPPKLSPPVVVNYGNIEAISAAPLYLAQERGYFTDVGLQVNVQPFTTGGDMIPVLANGQLDAGKGALSAGLFNAMARGLPIKIVADAGSNLPGFVYTSIVLRKQFADHFSGWADFKGRKFASTGLDNSGVYRFDRLMHSVGLTWKDADVVGLGSAEQIAAMTSGVLDGGTLIEPFLTKAVDDGTAAFPPGGREMSSGQQSAALVYGPGFTQSKPDAARRFMYAYLRGVRDYTNAFSRGVDKEAVITTLLANTSIKDRALYDRMGLPGLDPNGRVLQDDIEGQQQWFVANGIQQAAVEMSSVIDYQYVDYAIGLLGRAG
ncbi:MAG TPA: ABC transporter substrate-binding protein [Chloroflexota bacterium]